MKLQWSKVMYREANPTRTSLNLIGLNGTLTERVSQQCILYVKSRLSTTSRVEQYEFHDIVGSQGNELGAVRHLDGD